MHLELLDLGLIRALTQVLRSVMTLVCMPGVVTIGQACTTLCCAITHSIRITTTAQCKWLKLTLTYITCTAALVTYVYTWSHSPGSPQARLRHVQG